MTSTTMKRTSPGRGMPTDVEPRRMPLPAITLVSYLVIVLDISTGPGLALDGSLPHAAETRSCCYPDRSCW